MLYPHMQSNKTLTSGTRWLLAVLLFASISSLAGSARLPSDHSIKPLNNVNINIHEYSKWEPDLEPSNVHNSEPPHHETVKPSTANCTEEWIEQPIDHFSYSAFKFQMFTNQTFMQRYYTYDKYWDGKGPIFFYTGNEADVGLYVNATGLIWEHAEAFNAYIVFAEHRFYGQSLPNGAPPVSKGKPVPYLSHELALADYSRLIQVLKAKLNADRSPVIAFGGSYGGKLAAWLRMKYPNAVEGAISASAPLLAFPGENPTWKSQAYYQVVTNTAAHYSPNCAANVRKAFPLLTAEGATPAGRKRLQEAFHLCEVPEDAYHVYMLHYFLRDAYDSLAMGNYPYPSNYIAGTAEHPMPAWPMKEACLYLDTPELASATGSSELFQALRKSVAVLYNVTQDRECFNLPYYPTSTTPGAPMDGLWDWQWCTEYLPDSYWFTTDGVNDMFWDNPYNQSLVEEHCQLAWGVKPRRDWMVGEYGGRRLGNGHSNIVFSSGGFDGWSSGGVATNISDSLLSVFIPEGGHHLDLFFSHPDDPPSVVAARELELTQIRKWVEGYSAHKTARCWGDLLP